MAVIPSLEKSPVVPEDAIYRLSVEQYHDMIRSGILTEKLSGSRKTSA